MKKKILIVEDDEITKEGIEEYFKIKEYDVISAGDGKKAIKIFNEGEFDLVILDIMLPKADGFQVLKNIRKTSKIPVLMLTAMDDESTQIMSFDEKADDYMSKPFSLVVLEKRIEALIRRDRIKEDKYKDIWKYKDTRVDFPGFSAEYKGSPVDITPKEIQVLKLLVDHPGLVLSRIQMLDRIWDDDENPIDRVIDVYIKNLRKKLHLDCIITVKGIGYKYEEII